MRLLPLKRPFLVGNIVFTTAAQRLLRWVAFPTFVAHGFSCSSRVVYVLQQQQQQQHQHQHRQHRHRRHDHPHHQHHSDQHQHHIDQHQQHDPTTAAASIMPGTVLLTLTPQSFKLADLYSLAASMERGPAGNCERLFVDSGTGSALLRMNVHPLPAKEENEGPHSRSSATCATTRINSCSSWLDHLDSYDDINHSDTVPLPMFLQRSQWTGRVLASGSNAKEFLHHIRHGDDDDDDDGDNTPHWTRTVRHPWTLRYVCLGDHPPHERPTHRPHTANMLLCATAQALGSPSTKHSHPPPPPAALSFHEPRIESLILLDTWDKRGQAQLYLLQQLPATKTTAMRTNNNNNNNNNFPELWAKRPFEYSSALNSGIAELVVDILMHLLLQTKPQLDSEQQLLRQQQIRFLDPCCGSGTFLAGVLNRSLMNNNNNTIHVTGYDVNDKCVQGTMDNLRYAFGNATAERWSHVEQRDSSLPPQQQQQQPLFDCGACNLPWDLNTRSDHADENLQILAHWRRQLKPGAPCAIVSKGGNSSSTNGDDRPSIQPHDWEARGFRLLGQAQVPPPYFQLPQGNKQPRRAAPPRPVDQGRSHCWVTIVEAV